MAGTDQATLSAYRRAALPSPPTPWRDASFAVIDLETTGLDPAADEIIAFATVTVRRGRAQPGDATYRLVRPATMPGAESIRIHGLRPTDLEDAPPLPEVLGELLRGITGKVLVAHAAELEERFLGAAFERDGIVLRGPAVDTAALALELWKRSRRRFRSIRGTGLSELARSLGLPVHRPHQADGDALTTAQVFVALACHLDSRRPQTVGSLTELPRRLNAWQRLFQRN